MRERPIPNQPSDVPDSASVHAGRRRELYAGGLVAAIGAYAVVQGWSYHVGTLTAMGAGFFPVALGAILVLVGLAIAGAGQAAGGDGAARWRGVDWRGWTCIALGVIAFVALGRHGGLLPATFALVFVSALGDRRNSVLAALALAAGITVMCVLVFWWALQLQLPLLAWD